VLLGQLNISHSNISANTAHRNGGALLVGTVKEQPNATSTLWVSNTEFNKNTAQANGGRWVGWGGCGWLGTFGLPAAHSSLAGVGE
jgi:hypothetical protein